MTKILASVIALALLVPAASQARMSNGAAVGIGLGALALGTMMARPAHPQPRYYAPPRVYYAPPVPYQVLQCTWRNAQGYVVRVDPGPCPRQARPRAPTYRYVQ